MIFSYPEILSQAQLKRLSNHQYSCTGRTLLDPIVQPFWNWLVEKLPLWLAPNTMTIFGLLINIASSVLLMCYSPDATLEVPRWLFVLNAFTLFAYQTLDGCDGKQARRTNTSSPLGELCDHGCDALSTVFVGLAVCVTIQLGRYPYWMFFQCFSAMTLFYVAHWQTYVSGTLRFGKFDVTEAQFVIMLIYLVTAIFGPCMWSIVIPAIHIDLRLVPIIMGMIAASVAFYSNFTVIFTGGVGKNGSTVAGTSILSPIVPIAIVVVSAFTIYQKSMISIFQMHPCLYTVAFGMAACKITNKVVVAHMTKSEIDYLDSILIGPGMLFMNQYFNTFINEYIVLWLCLIYTTADWFFYCAVVCKQICTYLNISMFTIVPSLSPHQSAVHEDKVSLLDSASNGMLQGSLNCHKRS